MPAAPVSGDLIRLQNYVDDIATTLRRITANIPFMTDDEKKKLADHMKASNPGYGKVLELLEKGK
jgi:hypothetical protein